MRICYVALSPTLGMHQYTADLAHQQAGLFDGDVARAHVTVITPRSAPLDRYAPAISVQPVAAVTGTGLQRSNLSPRGWRTVYRAIRAARPDVVHFTSPHVWNPLLLWQLRRDGLPTVHTIHDLDPHSGTGYGRLLYAWNDAILNYADRIVVHGQLYRSRLLVRGLPAQRVSSVPLSHLFLSYQAEAAVRQSPPETQYEPFALFFARIEAYKGVDVLVEAMRHLQAAPLSAVIAGRGEVGALGELPANVELRNRVIEDREAIDLFSRCSVVVLPYRDATQSALIAAAYFFGKPVIVTRAGALPEYVRDGHTGWVVPPNDAAALAEALHHVAYQPDRNRQHGAAGRAWYRAQQPEARRTLRKLYEDAGRLPPTTLAVAQEA